MWPRHDTGERLQTLGRGGCRRRFSDTGSGHLLAAPQWRSGGIRRSAPLCDYAYLNQETSEADRIPGAITARDEASLLGTRESRPASSDGDFVMTDCNGAHCPSCRFLAHCSIRHSSWLVWERLDVTRPRRPV